MHNRRLDTVESLLVLPCFSMSANRAGVSRCPLVRSELGASFTVPRQAHIACKRLHCARDLLGRHPSISKIRGNLMHPREPGVRLCFCLQGSSIHNPPQSDIHRSYDPRPRPSRGIGKHRNCRRGIVRTSSCSQSGR